MILYSKYYTEVKNRFLLIFVSWFTLLNICYYYKEVLLFIIINSKNSLNSVVEKSYFIFTNVTEIFYLYIEVSLFITNQIIVIILIYQFFMFFSSGLYKFEYLKLKMVFKITFFSWITSIILLYNFIIPFSWEFFLSFQENSNHIQPIGLFFEAKISEYFYYFTDLYYICFINCHFLISILVLLTYFDEKYNKTTKTFRKLFYLIFIIFSTITTPPDILSQIILSFILIISYEILIFLKQVKTNMVTN